MDTKRPPFHINPYHALLSILFLLCICGGIILWIKSNVQESKAFEFVSPQMKMSILIPSNMDISESPNAILLRKEKESISISRVATNADGVEEYFTILKKQNKYEKYEAKPVTIDGKNSLLVELFRNDSTTSRVYFIYVDDWIYSIETSYPELYTDQDSLVNSFKYIPQNKK